MAQNESHHPPRHGCRRWIVAGAAVLVLVSILVLPAILMAGRVYPARAPIDDSPAQLGLAWEDITFRSQDGIELRGWYLPSPSATDRGIVLAHGIDDNRLQSGIALHLTTALLDRGFSVLLFDLRASGISGSAPQTLGTHERRDVLAAVAYIRSRGVRHVGVIGFSMGAVASILAAAYDPAIEALVTDSAYADLHVTLVAGMARGFYLPEPAAEIPLLWFRLLTGTDERSVRPVDVVGRISPRPLLIIHGTDDDTVSPADSALLLRAAGGTMAERWLVRGGGHTTSYRVEPAEYTRHIVTFFETSLGSPESADA